MEQEITNNDTVRKSLIQELEKTNTLGKEIQMRFVDLKIETISQSREWTKHITLLSSAITGSLLFLNDTNVNIINEIYLWFGASLHVFLIIFVLSYIKHVLNNDERELQIMEQKYKKILEQKTAIIYRYLNKSNLTDSDLHEYSNHLQQSEANKQLESDVDKNNIIMENMDKLPLDYFQETVLSIFCIGCLLILSAFFPNIISGYNIIMLPVFIILSIFFNFHLWLMKPVNAMANMYRNHK